MQDLVVVLLLSVVAPIQWASLEAGARQNEPPLDLEQLLEALHQARVPAVLDELLDPAV